MIKKILIVFIIFFISSCLRDNYRVFGGISTDIKDENQIVLSYSYIYEIGDILEDASKIANEHCSKFSKKAYLKNKDSGGYMNSSFTTLMFDCRK